MIDLPGIPSDESSELGKLVHEQQCVAFVGAALSIPPGKDWDGLVRQLADGCDVRYDENADLCQIVDLCTDRDEAQCNEVLRREFPRHIAATRTAMGHVLRLPFKAIVTTNFDPYLRQQARQEQYARYHVYPDLPMHCGIDGGLYYLHGLFDSEDTSGGIASLVFGERSFHDAYDNAESLLPGFVLDILVYESILFIGFNPAERHFASLLLRSRNIRNRVAMSARLTSAPSKRFALWPKPFLAPREKLAVASTAIDQIASLDVVPVLYDPEADDRRGLERLLFGWVEQGDLEARPPPRKTGFEMH